MNSIIIVLSVLLSAVVVVSILENIKANKRDYKGCGCGKTNDKDGKCDGSHTNDV